LTYLAITQARLVAGITLFAGPTIVYGGITLLGMLTL
jgi:hypothetical protein